MSSPRAYQWPVPGLRCQSSVCGTTPISTGGATGESTSIRRGKGSPSSRSPTCALIQPYAPLSSKLRWRTSDVFVLPPLLSGASGSQLVYVTGSPDAQTQVPSCARSFKPASVSHPNVAEIQWSSASSLIVARWPPSDTAYASPSAHVMPSTIAYQCPVPGLRTQSSDCAERPLPGSAPRQGAIPGSVRGRTPKTPRE